ncbi:MAG: DUF3761 domain-containing protein [Patescibacteria group bacterium]|nr:DUF3761 domain-containing protein [Patescibacteria group bacterium]
MKKALFIGLVFVFFTIIGNYGQGGNNTNTNYSNATQQQVLGESVKSGLVLPEKKFVEPSVNKSSDVINSIVNDKYEDTNVNIAKPLEPIKYYENSQGNTVQSPTQYDAIPTGVSAKCRDGSYSFSQSRRGTCSHHGGVVVWY